MSVEVSSKYTISVCVLLPFFSVTFKENSSASMAPEGHSFSGSCQGVRGSNHRRRHCAIFLIISSLVSGNLGGPVCIKDNTYL